MAVTRTISYVDLIHSMVERLEEAMSLLYNGFIYSQNIPLESALEYVEWVKEREKELTPELVERASSDEIARVYTSIPGHLERIASNIEHIIRIVEQKNRENILFSDKAVSEMNFLFNRIKEVLSNLSDLVLARNKYLANYIIESEAEIERTANEFSTLHEERLIEGVCMPRASGIYVIILDSLKRIAWNAKEIAAKLA